MATSTLIRPLSHVLPWKTVVPTWFDGQVNPDYSLSHVLTVTHLPGIPEDTRACSRHDHHPRSRS